MGWFTRPSAPATRLSVLYADGRTAAGGAALLSPHRVLTCAHVVNDALGRDLYESGPPEAAELTVALHGSGDRGPGPQHRAARVSVWVPPRPAASTTVWRGDLAVLELTEPAPPGPRPVVWRDMAEGQELRAWHGGGAAITFADTRVKLQEDAVGYLDGELSGGAIGPGFSGGPLWSLSDETVVGLVVAHVLPERGRPLGAQDPVRRSWAVPWRTVREELRRAGAAEVLEDCAVHRRAGRDDPVPGALAAELWRLLGDPALRAQHARTLAAALGYEPPAGDSAPSVEELTAVLAAEERALATLSESLAAAAAPGTGRDSLDRLLIAGQLAGARLLSVDEHRLLVAELADLVAADATLLPRAAREALRYTPLPEPLAAPRLSADDIGPVVTDLESYRDGGALPDGTAPVPALLKLVEYAAAGASARSSRALTAWSDRVAGRLGVHRAALSQRRGDAAAWAAHRPSPVVRLVAELRGAPADDEGRFRCEVWEVRGDGTAARLVAADRPRSPTEIGRLIRESAERAADGGPPVEQIDVVVGRDGLELDVDEWDAGSPLDFLRGVPLGVTYRVAMRCPEVSARAPRREAELRRRWESGRAGPLVVDERTSSPERVYALLASTHRDTAQVVVHGPPGDRERLVQLCLAVGVPVVLWDRQAEGHQHAHRLDAVTPAGPLHQLPERVRHFRAERYGAPSPGGARPSLVWEDTELPLPGGLELLDPAEGADIR
ncbi:VMAP-C domain-containing protein [Streptomyces sp. WMMC940]|uniref:VMAP-C domain-containing protein n=1 Tax=Streptomyces sp. WMMC940 TaxID=3015153 RepID=UPI0022B64812|nr:trypsin-like peptidase domain-containing protein [Streptomyces sp. WMMC940]MCZ7457041.1 trypsin-like peptidase domain-containing protein [Streptomyces sp. WMMC940]